MFISSLFSRVVRKSIARVLTVINQTQKENLRKFYKVSLTPLKYIHALTYDALVEHLEVMFR